MKWIFTPPQFSRCLQIIFCAVALIPASVSAIDTEQEDVQAFIEKLATQDGFDAEYVETILANSEIQQSILDAMSRPAEKVKPWHEYRAIFITPKRIQAGVDFYAEHYDTIARITDETGVPAEMILGIVGVESYYGRITGKHRVVDALATLGFAYPPRSTFFRSELGHAFLLAREEDMDLAKLVGSYAGAMGPPQFIPSSYRAYAVDGDGDGKRDLIGSWEDILASVANYFVAHKWRRGQPVSTLATIGDQSIEAVLNDQLKPQSTVGALSKAGVFFPTELDSEAAAGVWQLEGEDGFEYWVGFDNLYVITRYNRSIMYALAAWELGQAVTHEAASQ